MTDKPDLNIIRPELENKLSELEILRQSLEKSKENEKKVYDQLLRLGAEFDNFRKRSEIRLKEARAFGREEVLLSVLSICDVMDQAHGASHNSKDVGGLKKGFGLVVKQFEKFLGDLGVKPVPSVGKKLDPHLHEAVAQNPDSALEEGTITDEIQKGYQMDHRVLRPARVRVAVKPSEEVKK